MAAAHEVPQPAELPGQPSLQRHPHWAQPHDLPIALQTADVIVTSLPLLRGRFLVTECQHAIPFGGKNNVAVFDDYRVVEGGGSKQAVREYRRAASGEC